MMRYVKSRDGIERATLYIKHRVTREDYQWLRQRAKRNDMTVHEYLGVCLDNGINEESLIADEEAEIERRSK